MKKNYWYRVLVAIIRPILHIIFPHRVTGAENIPEDGAVLLCSNHVSMIDPVFLACKAKREIRFLAKKELTHNKLMGFLIDRLRAVPVERGASDMAAMRTCMGVLKEGSVLGVFPQGHRYKKDENREIQSGAAIMALRTRVPVIPVHISSPVKAFRFTKIEVGKPLELSDIARLDAPSIAEAEKRMSAAMWPRED